MGDRHPSYGVAEKRFDAFCFRGQTTEWEVVDLRLLRSMVSRSDPSMMPGSTVVRR